MNVEDIKQKLKHARAKQRDLRKEIDQYRDMLRNAGEDPDKPQVDLTERNKQIYILWKEGNSFADIAKEYDRSVTTISSVCRRIDIILERRRFRFQEYKDMLKYKRRADKNNINKQKKRKS